MKISILIPCHNEERGISATILSCLEQSRPADEIVIVDDGSTDSTRALIQEAVKQHPHIKAVLLDQNTGIKSKAQEEGLKYVTGDVFITLDADTVVSYHFVKRVEIAFKDEGVVAFSGYVQSRKRNILTACREIEYIISQNIFKYAHSILGFIYVIPGCAGAFRTNYFKREIIFDHDTLAEDLDLSYYINASKFRIVFDRSAIVHTNDPENLRDYIGQVRRWYGGGWQCLPKHIKGVLNRPMQTLILSLMFVEGLTGFLGLIFLLLVDLEYFLMAILFALIVATCFGTFAAVRRRRIDILFATIFYPFLHMLNTYLFLEQFVKNVVFRSKSMIWYKPVRY